MTIIEAVILGLVEGISEYLPISSTGHLILASNALGLDLASSETKSAVDAFNIVIQGGAILAVLILYWPRFLGITRGVLSLIVPGNADAARARENAAGVRLAFNLLIAFVPAAVVGPLLDHFLERHLFFAGPVIAAMALGGVYMIAIEQWRVGRFSTARFHAADREIGDVTAPQALFIGAMQCVAMIPGTSRSMMTITAGILTGLRPRAAAEFSFLLGVPTLGAACLYKLAKNLYYAGKPITNPTDGQGGVGEVHRSLFEVLGVGAVVIGMVAATVSAMIAVRWLVGFLNRHGLAAFGVYRLLLALCLVGLLLGRVVQWP